MMDTATAINLVSTAGAVAAFLVSFYFAFQSKKSASRAESVSMGTAETSLRSAISSTRQRVEDFSIQIAMVMEEKATESPRREILKKAFRSAVEDNLNAYEDACAKYIDAKIDRERFKKSYISEIQTLCTEKSGVISELLHPAETSKFQAIWKVYREWHILETDWRPNK